LTHWPVQIRLVPPHAPYLQNADLLVAADCVPVATGEFHRTLLPGRVALIGCPKFDDVQLYVQRFADIFAQNTIRSVTVAVMEVPCCQSLPAVVMRGMEQAGVRVPLETVTVQLTGEILKRTALIA